MDLSAGRLTQRNWAWLSRGAAPAAEDLAAGEAATEAARFRPSAWRFGTAAVRALEALLRRRLGIYEFTTDEACIFRLASSKAEELVTLSDGTAIRPGDGLLELHLWNEHLPAIPFDGPRIAWGLVMHNRAQHSLRLLAAHLEGGAVAPEIRALHGEAAFTSRIGRRQMRRVAYRYGFDLLGDHPPLHRRFRYFWENFLIVGLIWTFNPCGLRGKRLVKERYELWISREELLRRYAGVRRAQAGD